MVGVVAGTEAGSMYELMFGVVAGIEAGSVYDLMAGVVAGTIFVDVDDVVAGTKGGEDSEVLGVVSLLVATVLTLVLVIALMHKLT